MAACWLETVTWPISSHLAIQVIIQQETLFLHPPVSNNVTMELHLATIWSTNAATATFILPRQLCLLNRDI